MTLYRFSPRNWPACEREADCRVEEPSALIGQNFAALNRPNLIGRSGEVHVQPIPKPVQHFRCVTCGKTWSEEA